jgi:hypothetical protein
MTAALQAVLEQAKRLTPGELETVDARQSIIEARARIRAGTA